MEDSLETIVQQVQSKELYVHSIRPKDMSTRRNLDIYEVFYLVYNQNDEIVRNFFWCTKCKFMLFCNLGLNGNATLTRHRCYQEYLTMKNSRLAKTEVDKKSKMLVDLSVDELVLNNDDNKTERNINDDHSNGIKKGSHATLSASEQELILTAFAAYGELCAAHGALNQQELKKIIPTDFDGAKWYMPTYFTHSMC